MFHLTETLFHLVETLFFLPKPVFLLTKPVFTPAYICHGAIPASAAAETV